MMCQLCDLAVPYLVLDKQIEDEDNGEDDLLGSYPIKGLSMTAKECGVSR
jgi:hypothetical protein